jgi:protein gp37
LTVAELSNIEWTEATWNPVTGCTKVSPGCKHCYAERLANRLKAMGVDRYRDGFEVRMHEHLLEEPLRWRRPRRIFVNSMSDLFHEEVSLEFIGRVFDVIRRAPWHEFQVLTKRAERLARVASSICWPENAWMGVSVESRDYLERIDLLRSVPARVRFLSVEPLLGPLGELRLDGIHWVIVGGESGPGARPMKVEWVREIRDQCVREAIPFFFKQWGGVRKSRSGRELDGLHWDRMPAR